MLIHQSAIDSHKTDEDEKLNDARNQIVEADLPASLHFKPENPLGNTIKWIHF